MSEMLPDDVLERMTDGYCPDCNHRGWILGPRGGQGMNITCGGCGTLFVIAQAEWSHQFVLAYRVDR